MASAATASAQDGGSWFSSFWGNVFVRILSSPAPHVNQREQHSCKPSLDPALMRRRKMVGNTATTAALRKGVPSSNRTCT
jgi:hypothetical protein